MKRLTALVVAMFSMFFVGLVSQVVAQNGSADEGAGLAVAASDQWGEHLVDSNGFSLYLYVLDEEGTVACVDACSNNWPPFLAQEGEESTIAGELDAALVGAIARPDGTSQVTYGGHPLYSYRRDTEPGHTRGQALGDQFYLLDIAGEAITEEAETEAIELPEEEMAALLEEGGLVFRTHCSVCHGAAGQGGIGPGFVGNSQLNRTDYVVNRILDGFIDHGMPPFEGVLSDRQIAAVSTHIRNSWGNEFGPVLEEEVASER